MNTPLLKNLVADPLARNSALVTIAAAAVAIFIANPPPAPDVLIRPAAAAVLGEWPAPAAEAPRVRGSENPSFSVPTAPIEPRPQAPTLTPAAPLDRFIAR